MLLLPGKHRTTLRAPFARDPGDQSSQSPSAKASSSRPDRLGLAHARLRVMSDAARVLSDALSLSEEERVRIAEELLLSVRPEGIASADDAATLIELRARAAEVRNGDRSGPTWAELRKNLERE